MKRSSHFFALALVALGAVLLLDNLGVVTVGFSLIWPMFALGYGIYLLLQFKQNHQSDVLSPAAFFILMGLFVISTHFFTWPESLPWWPFFPMFWGVGNLLTWLSGGRRDNGMLLQCVILVGSGFFILLGSTFWADSYLKFWPVILIAVGLILLFGRKFGPAQRQENSRRMTR